MTVAKLLTDITEYEKYIHISPQNTERGVEFVRDIKNMGNSIVTLDMDLDVDGVLSTKIMYDTLSEIGVGKINVHIPKVKRHGIDIINIENKKDEIIIITKNNYFILKFLTEYDHNQTYCRIMFILSNYYSACLYLTGDFIYLNNYIVDCSISTTTTTII